jgi:hypothetical protein
MTSRSHRPDKPTIYLDHSTLCDAFKAVHIDPDGADTDRTYAPLCGWVERVSVEANLCLSVFHLADLAGWTKSSASVMARWLDTLEIVWMLNPQQVERAEGTYWLKVAAGVRVAQNKPTPVCRLASGRDGKPHAGWRGRSAAQR